MLAAGLAIITADPDDGELTKGRRDISQLRGEDLLESDHVGLESGDAVQHQVTAMCPRGSGASWIIELDVVGRDTQGVAHGDHSARPTGPADRPGRAIESAMSVGAPRLAW